MFTIHTILHPTDFSPLADCAFKLACTLARDYKARLVLLHVNQPPPPPVMGEFGLLPQEPIADETALMERLSKLQATDPALKVERHVRRGDPAAEVLQMIQECNCDLIVMGTHGRTGLSRLLVGSVAEAVLRKATCPVLTVKAPVATTAHQASDAASS